MLICVITAMAQKTLPCSIMSWPYIAMFQSPIENLMSTLHPILHRLILGRIWCTPWALTFWGAFQMYPSPASTLFNSSSHRAKPMQKFVMSGYLPAAYGLLIHTIFPARISTPISYQTPHFPLNLNKEKGFPGMAGPCCGMCTSVPSTLIRQSFKLPLSFLLLKKSWGNKAR